MSVTTQQRALVVVSFIARRNQFTFYNFAQAAGIATIRAALSLSYGSIDVLENSNATKANFVSKLRSISRKSGIKAIDVIMMVHGGNGVLCFYDADINADTLGNEIHALGINKLRLYYSTACYGATHNHGLRHAGFCTAIGSQGVNTNGASEFPTVLSLWALGNDIYRCVHTGMVGYELMDSAVRGSFPDADSYKEIWGKHHISINSNPR